MDAREFLDTVLFRLRRRRWVVTNPRVLEVERAVQLGFDFTCPCGRVIKERIAFGLKAGVAQFNEEAVRHWVPAIERELEKHVTEEFGGRDG